MMNVVVSSSQEWMFLKVSNVHLEVFYSFKWMPLEFYVSLCGQLESVLAPIGSAER